MISHASKQALREIAVLLGGAHCPDFAEAISQRLDGHPWKHGYRIPCPVAADCAPHELFIYDDLNRGLVVKSCTAGHRQSTVLPALLWMLQEQTKQEIG